VAAPPRPHRCPLRPDHDHGRLLPPERRQASGTDSRRCPPNAAETDQARPAASCPRAVRRHQSAAARTGSPTPLLPVATYR
jgi:hypothetical protein